MKPNELPIVHHDEEQGVWRCGSCGWVYPNPNPSLRNRREHTQHCGESTNVQRWLDIQDAPEKGTELNDVPEIHTEQLVLPSDNGHDTEDLEKDDLHNDTPTDDESSKQSRTVKEVEKVEPRDLADKDWSNYKAKEVKAMEATEPGLSTANVQDEKDTADNEDNDDPLPVPDADNKIDEIDYESVGIGNEQRGESTIEAGAPDLTKDRVVPKVAERSYFHKGHFGKGEDVKYNIGFEFPDNSTQSRVTEIDSVEGDLVEVSPAQESGNRTEHVGRLAGPPSPLEEAPKWVNSLMLNSQEEGDTFSIRKKYWANRSRSGYLLVDGNEGSSSSSAHVEIDFEQAMHEQNTYDMFCPVCGSDVTKRIILKKKMTTRVPKDDVRLPKAREVLPVDRHDEAWGCLGCLSLFVSKEGRVRKAVVPGAEGELIGTEQEEVRRLPLPIRWRPWTSEPELNEPLLSETARDDPQAPEDAEKKPSDLREDPTGERCNCLPALPKFSMYDVFKDHHISPEQPLPGTEVDDIRAPLPGTTPPTTEIVVTIDQRIKVTGPTQEYLKSIVHGGLDVTLVSLGVVASGAGGDAKTITVIAIGLANLVFGLITHLGTIMSLYYNNRFKFVEDIGKGFVHGCLSFISFLFFGALAPITYGFSFRNATNRDYKFASTCVVALVCIVLLGAAQAHVKSKSAVRVISFLIVIGFAAVTAGYETGNYVGQLLKYFGFDSV